MESFYTDFISNRRNRRIILKKRVNIDEDDEVKTLQKKVQSLEYKAYSMAIRRMYAFD